MREFIDFKDGLLLINKHAGVSSFGIIKILQDELSTTCGLKRKEFPKLGHGGTLDPFATGLLTVCVGKGVKLARYFLGATKTYEGVILFGQTTVPGDPTAPISETSDSIPESLEQLQKLATALTKQAYSQTPPMHSAKKVDGKPLYELARAGIEIDRDPKICQLYRFEILSYEKPRAHFRLVCSSGTYVRTLSQDFAKLLGSVGMLESLSRTAIGGFQLENAWNCEQITQAMKEGKAWTELPCWIPFDKLLEGYDSVQVTSSETAALFQGKQSVLLHVLKRSEPNPSLKNPIGLDQCLAIYEGEKLIAVARKDDSKWGLERVFVRGN